MMGHTGVLSTELPLAEGASRESLPARPEWQLAAGCACLAAAALAILSAAMPKEGTPHGDDLIYEDIARRPFGVHTFPFGFRFGLPLLVHVLPIAHGTGFSILAILCAGGAAGFAYLLIRELGGGRALAGTFAVLMCLSPPFLVVMLRHGRNTDIATVFLMMAATYFAVRRRYWQLAVTLLIGVAVREAVLRARLGPHDPARCACLLPGQYPRPGTPPQTSASNHRCVRTAHCGLRDLHGTLRCADGHRKRRRTTISSSLKTLSAPAAIALARRTRADTRAARRTHPRADHSPAAR